MDGITHSENRPTLSHYFNNKRIIINLIYRARARACVKERLHSIHGTAPRIPTLCRSQWPRGLRHGSTAVRLLGLQVRIPPGAWMFVSGVYYVLSGTSFCAGLTPVQKNPTECGVSECDHEASPWPTRGCRAMGARTEFPHRVEEGLVQIC